MSNTASKSIHEMAINDVEIGLFQEFAKFMQEGGPFMWALAIILMIGISISIERVFKLFLFDTDGASIMREIKKEILNNDYHKAITNCSNAKGVLPKVLKSGLKRANQTKEQINDAIEGSIYEFFPQLDKRLSHLSLLANISTLVGLLGTIQGLIQSFSAVADSDPASKAKLLALGISKAMNTTAAGLICAITLLLLHQVLISKSEKIQSEVIEFSSKLIDILGTKRSNANSNVMTNKNQEAA